MISNPNTFDSNLCHQNYRARHLKKSQEFLKELNKNSYNQNQLVPFIKSITIQFESPVQLYIT